MAGGRSFDADACVAWPTAEICAMSVEGAVYAVYRRDYEAADDPAARRQQLIDTFKSQLGALRRRNTLERYGDRSNEDTVFPDRDVGRMSATAPKHASPKDLVDFADLGKLINRRAVRRSRRLPYRSRSRSLKSTADRRNQRLPLAFIQVGEFIDQRFVFFADHFRLNLAGCDRIHPNTEFREFDGQFPCEGGQGGLRSEYADPAKGWIACPAIEGMFTTAPWSWRLDQVQPQSRGIA